MKKVLFKDFGLFEGNFNQYAASVKARSIFGISATYADKLIKYAVRNERLFVDELTIEEYRCSQILESMPSDKLEDEIAIHEHEQYMFECGLTSCGHDWSE
mgnify:FL=1|tara:strand:- start:37 stop:339 length:303 start_codon:yes stop_codon:yes gene_type:complete